MTDCTDDERRRLAVVRSHLYMLGEVTRDPGRVSDLAALLAEDFIWQTPSTDPARGVARDRASYLALFANADQAPVAECLVELEVELLAVTVQGKRIAGETMSTGRRGDGITYSNRYHQLWRFDDDDRIAEYRIYADTQHLAALHAAGHELIARRFIDGLALGATDRVTDILGDGLRWHIHHSSGERQIFDRAGALLHIAAEPLAGLAPVADAMPSHGDETVVEAAMPSGATHLFFLTFEAGLIAGIREYRLQAADRII